MVQIARTPDGRRLEVARRVNTNSVSAWELLATPERWPDWGPSVRAIDCDQAQISEGTTGRVQIPGGLWISFEIITCREPTDEEPGRWTWRVAKIPATGHRVESVGTGCRVAFEIPLAAAGYAPVCSRALDRIEELLDCTG